MVKTGGEVTAEYSDTPDRQRGIWLQAARAQRYRVAKQDDPETVAEYERRLEERRKRS